VSFHEEEALAGSIQQSTISNSFYQHATPSSFDPVETSMSKKEAAARFGAPMRTTEV
jgi:hypothetical protein